VVEPVAAADTIIVGGASPDAAGAPTPPNPTLRMVPPVSKKMTFARSAAVVVFALV
jgi:hypothetical protein